jgi:viroplasmin and RNaseH domain-containing protein
MEEKYYVVFKGRKTGIFLDTWENVKTLTDGFSGSKYKNYDNEELAREAYGEYRGLKAKIREVKL